MEEIGERLDIEKKKKVQCAVAVRGRQSEVQ